MSYMIWLSPCGCGCFKPIRLVVHLILHHHAHRNNGLGHSDTSYTAGTNPERKCIHEQLQTFYSAHVSYLHYYKCRVTSGLQQHCNMVVISVLHGFMAL